MVFAPVCRLEYEQRLPLTLSEAWDFFSRPKNLAEITPENLAFEVTSPLPERMYAGMIVNYRVRPLPVLPCPGRPKSPMSSSRSSLSMNNAAGHTACGIISTTSQSLTVTSG